MIWLILGLLLWMVVHFFRRIFPKARASMDEKLGANGAKGLIAVLLVISIIMMVIGYRSAGYNALYYPPHWMSFITILLGYFAVVLMGAGNSKNHLREKLRHPMLMGVIAWSVGHLFSSGEWRAIILFGGMIIWAALEIRLINAKEPEYTAFEGGTRKGDIRLALISAVIAAVIIGVHIWIIRG